LKVVKRDGVVAKFDNNRIYLAIQKAANAASQAIENIFNCNLFFAFKFRNNLTN
jgi:anaerobic ribonucleoside-triphosphate reductase